MRFSFPICPHMPSYAHLCPVFRKYIEEPENRRKGQTRAKVLPVSRTNEFTYVVPAVTCMIPQSVILTAVLRQVQLLRICRMTGVARSVVSARICFLRKNNQEAKSGVII